MPDNALNVHHVGVIVRSVDESASKLSQCLGLQGWEIHTVNPEMAQVDGQRVVHSFRGGIVVAGGIGIELLAPVEGPSVYSRFLEKRGQGLHHLCLTFGSEAEEKRKKEELETLGGKTIQSGVTKRAIYDYVELDEIVLELLYLRER